MRQDSVNRLNDFMESMRRDVAADLAAKNLGDEGCAYIAEALAFNARCILATRRLQLVAAGMYIG